MSLKQRLAALWMALLAVAPACDSALAQPTPAAVLADGIKERAATAAFWADWDEVARLFAAAKLDPTPSREGWQASCEFMEGAARSFGNRAQTWHEALSASTLAWVRRQPDSPLAHTVHLNALVQRAWFHRGGGYSDTVSEQSLAEFNAKLQEALSYFNANAAVITREAVHLGPVLWLARGAGIDQERQLGLARQALQLSPGDACLQRIAITGLLPKWGGDERRVDAWIRESMRDLSPDEALMRYAVLYSSASSGDFKERLFERSLARWPMLKDGLQRLVQAHPASVFWRNRRAYFACMAQDRESAASALEALDTAPGAANMEHWGDGGKQTYQACRRWALQS